MNNLFTYIKASSFFPRYAPGVTNWRRKLPGTNQPETFTDEDKKLIRAGVERMMREIK